MHGLILWFMCDLWFGKMCGNTKNSTEMILFENVHAKFILVQAQSGGTAYPVPVPAQSVYRHFTPLDVGFCILLV